MRPEISSELVKKVVEKWKQENKLSIEIPKSRIIEDILLKYLENNQISQIRDRKRDKLFRTLINVKSRITHSKNNPIKINSLEFGNITINNKKYDKDVIISYKGLVKEIQTQIRHLISKKEFSSILSEKPEVIVVGTGIEGDMEISSDVQKIAEQKGILLLSFPSLEAIKKFKQLYESGKKVVAYIHITC
ncbi:MAG: MTH938/NDUFAF3 family protein [Candidatus Aenigmatarchaeota archaeon]